MAPSGNEPDAGDARSGARGELRTEVHMAAVLFFLFTAAIGIGATLVEMHLHVPVILPLVLATATWAAWDSTRIGIRDYRSGIALSPVTLWFGIALLWIVGFPWYLTVRYRI